MTTKTLAAVVLAGLGLAVYLWPALAAPAVLWSDSTVDLEWARKGVGIYRPAPRGGHPAKPAYLLFLRGATALPFPGGEARRVVLAQSLLLWAAIGAAALAFAKKRGAAGGAALYILLILFLRLRDSASAVMTEAFSAAIFLPIAICVLWPPRRASGLLLSGLGVATLFWARPNLGAIALALLTMRLASARAWTAVLTVFAVFAVVGIPVWLATRPPERGDPLGGLSYPLLEATADYYWRPAIEPWPRANSPQEQMRAELLRAESNWKARLAFGGPDSRRELLWRAFHGLFGTEFYDARWSLPYERATAISRVLTPLLILAALALLLALGIAGAETGAGIAGMFLCVLLVAQNVVLGSNPRYVLPALPALLLFGAVAASAWKSASIPRRVATGLLFATLTAGVAAARHVVDWQWGVIEASAVRLVQEIPKGALPPKEPATLHLRIASPVVPTAAGLDVFGLRDRLLYTSVDDPARQRAFLTIPLPAWLLEANRSRPVELLLLSRGSYGPESYLLFPVIPPPWGSAARREGSEAISPATGIDRGSLDWWAHVGAP